MTAFHPKKRYLQQMLSEQSNERRGCVQFGTADSTSSPSHSMSFQVLNNKLLDIDNTVDRQSDTYRKIICLLHKQNCDTVESNNLLAGISDGGLDLQKKIGHIVLPNQQTAGVQTGECEILEVENSTGLRLVKQTSTIAADCSSSYDRSTMDPRLMKKGVIDAPAPASGPGLGPPGHASRWMGKASQGHVPNHLGPDCWPHLGAPDFSPPRQPLGIPRPDGSAMGNGVHVKEELMSDDESTDDKPQDRRGTGYVTLSDKPGDSTSGIIPPLWNHLQGPIPKLPYVLCEDGSKKADYSGISQLLNMNLDTAGASRPGSPPPTECDTTEGKLHPGMSSWARERSKRPHPGVNAISKEKVARLGDMVYYVTTSGRNKGSGKDAMPKHSCQICGDVAGGFHCGAFVCEACKKFYLRCLKSGNNLGFSCPKSQQCVITKETRSHCQFCRYQKCVTLGMYKPGKEDDKQLKIDFKSIPCKVCEAPSSGFHFGAITCEGCKGFFRRMLKESIHRKFTCSGEGKCAITSANRTTCKTCRYQKCLQVGMTLAGTRLGRQSNSVKRSTLLTITDTVAGEDTNELDSRDGGQEDANEYSSGDLPQYTPACPNESDLPAAKDNDSCVSTRNIPLDGRLTTQTPGAQPGKRARSHDHRPVDITSAVFPPTRGIFTNGTSFPSNRSPPNLSFRQMFDGSREAFGPEGHPSLVTGERFPTKPPAEIGAPLTSLVGGDPKPNMTPAFEEPEVAELPRRGLFATNEQKMKLLEMMNKGAKPSGSLVSPGLPDPPLSTTNEIGRHAHRSDSCRPYHSPVENTEGVADNGSPATDKQAGDGSARERHRTEPEDAATYSAESLGRSSASSGEPRAILSEKEEVALLNLMREKGNPLGDILHEADDGFRVEVIKRAMWYLELDSVKTSGDGTEPAGGEQSTPARDEPAVAAPEGPDAHRIHPPVEVPWSPEITLPQKTLDIVYAPPSETSTDEEESKTWNLLQSSPTNWMGVLTRDDSTFTGLHLKASRKSLPCRIEWECLRNGEWLVQALCHAYRDLDCIEDRPPTYTPTVDVERGGDRAFAAWSIFDQSFQQHAKYFIKYIKKIPGFRRLPLCDQVQLTQDSLYPIILIYHSPFYNSSTKQHRWFHNTQEEIDFVLQNLTQLKALNQHFHSTGYMLSSLKLDKVERALLSALVVFGGSERQKLTAGKDIDDIRDQVLNALITHLDATCCLDPNRLGMLLARLPELQRANIEMLLVAAQISCMYTNIRFNQLWQELYLQTKSKDFKQDAIPANA